MKEMQEYQLVCRLCRETTVIEADPDDIRKWGTGTLIQDALPYLPAGHRELLMSATCDSCWQELFPPMDD